jgi:hypothetical protein
VISDFNETFTNMYYINFFLFVAHNCILDTIRVTMICLI